MDFLFITYVKIYRFPIKIYKDLIIFPSKSIKIYKKSMESEARSQLEPNRAQESIFNKEFERNKDVFEAQILKESGAKKGSWSQNGPESKFLIKNLK